MRRIDGHEHTGDALAGGVVAIGNFDGLHRGHQALFGRAMARAQERRAPSGVLTFEPHPSKVLAPHLAPPLILTLDEKLQGLDDAGVDVTVVQPFTRDFARLSPDAFVEEVLVSSLKVSGVVVGQDFSFGYKGAGKVKDLRRLLEPRGVSVDALEPVMEGGLVCSSTKIREFILEGRVDAAGLLLGRPYWLSGDVRTGDARGRKMGIPTANLETGRELLPKIGVYATRAHLEDGRAFPSVTNIGLRPTFRGEGVRIEVHLLDFEGDLYDQRVSLTFHARLRDEKRFAGPDELKAQIERDIRSAREILDGGHGA